MSPILDSPVLRWEMTYKLVLSRSKGYDYVTRSLEEFYRAHPSPFTIIHHQDHFHTVCSWFRCIPTIFVNWGIIMHNLIKFTKGVILIILFDGIVIAHWNQDEEL